MNKRLLFAVVFACGLTLALVGCSLNKVDSKVSQSVEQKVISYDGVESRTAYDLLKEKYKVEVDQSSFGVMVRSINGLKNSDKEFWLYSVNDKQPDVAADKYITKIGDKIKWEYKSM
jgi:hypothetical protein